MTAEQIAADVLALEASKKRLETRAQNERRKLSFEEERAVKEMDSAIAELKNAAPSPLTVVGPGAASVSRQSEHVFGSLGEQMRAIAAAGTPSGQADPRLFRAAATGLGETIPSDGGFLLQPNFSTEIYQASFEVGKLAKLCRRIPITQGNALKIPGLDETSRVAGSRHGGVRSYWLDEAAEKIASKPKFRAIELQLKKDVVLVYTTDELLSDVNALGEYVRRVAPDELAFSLDEAIIRGTGAGQPLGVLNAGCLVTQAAEAGQTSGILLENVSKMWSRLLPSSRPNAVWLIGTGVEPALYQMSLAVGVGGGPVFLPAGGASAAPYMTLFGRPIIPCEQCSALNTTGDIVLADFANGYILAEKSGGVQADVSIHVRFVYDESVFRFVMRVDGQPALASAVTPYQGGASYTQSHFVALATRS